MSLVKVYISFLGLTCLVNNVFGEKILIFAPFPMRSHGILGRGFVEELVKANYSVTFVCPFSTNLKHPNLREIDITSITDLLPSGEISIDQLIDNIKPPEAMINYRMYEIATTALIHPNVIKLLNDPQEQFDVVIAEWMISELYAGLSSVFNCPLIWFSTMEPHWMVHRLMDEHPNPAYSPDFKHTHVNPMNFQERVEELVGHTYSTIIYWFKQKILDEPAYKEIFAPLVEKRGRSLPPYDEIRYSAALLLANGYVSFNEPLRLAASVKMIGGFHIDTQAVQTVEQDLKRIMDDSKDGFIYFSMGSHLKSSAFPESIKEGLLKMFRGLKQSVVWKYEKDDLHNVPKNVYVQKWIPQLAVLGHPNCRLFITHGGLLSLMEANYHGVPVLGVPGFGDQHVNIHKAVQRGFARRISLGYDLHARMEKEIKEMLTNTRYATVAKELSVIYHHRMIPPRAELVHWVEEVLITKGAGHLRSPALGLTWYQKLYLDLLVIVLAVSLSLRYIYRRIFGKLVKKVEVRKKKN